MHLALKQSVVVHDIRRKWFRLKILSGGGVDQSLALPVVSSCTNVEDARIPFQAWINSSHKSSVGQIPKGTEVIRFVDPTGGGCIISGAGGQMAVDFVTGTVGRAFFVM